MSGGDDDDMHSADMPPDADFLSVDELDEEVHKRTKQRVMRLKPTPTSRGEMRWRSQKNGPNYLEFTEDGKALLYDNLLAGATQEEICDFFTITPEEYVPLISAGGQCHHVFRRATAELRIKVRKAQLTMSHVNASAAKLVGTHVLGQGSEPLPDDQTKHVVGAMPDFEATTEDWAHQFAPRQIANASTIEQIRKENEAKGK